MYILENRQESKRLEKQLLQPAYDIEHELRNCAIPVLGSFLDAGCGTGILTRHLLKHHSNLKAYCCDLSEERLIEAGRAVPGAICFKSDLESIALPDDSVDAVFCRYVYEYLRSPDEVSREFYRVLKAGGLVNIIDFDGIVFNFHTSDPKLTALMSLLQQGLKEDYFVGRKLPHYLSRAGFSNISYQVDVHQFSGRELLQEQDNMQQRFEFAHDTVKRILGSTDLANEFRERYLEQMENPCNVLFYNKFVVRGMKC